jgi:hypothetical protein
MLDRSGSFGMRIWEFAERVRDNNFRPGPFFFYATSKAFATSIFTTYTTTKHSLLIQGLLPFSLSMKLEHPEYYIKFLEGVKN